VPGFSSSIKEICSKRQILRFSKQDEFIKEFLRNFLAENKVFSYLIINRYLFNYTAGINF
jgi:hypothetical protein